jgi:RNA polymerase sigma factor (sigma-70 family)
MRVTILLEPILAKIIDGCINNDRESQRKFYAYFYGFAYAICQRYLPLHDEIVEKVNDGFLKIYGDLHRFENRQTNLEQSLKAWMRRIFVNTCIDQLRKNKSYKNTFTDNEPVEADSFTAEIATSNLSFKEIVECINELSPAYKLVFNLFVFDGRSHEEIAEILNISVGTSKSNLARARVNLQKILISKNYYCYEQKAI